MTARLGAVLCVALFALAGLSQKSHALIITPCKTNGFPEIVAHTKIKIPARQVSAFDIEIKSYASKGSYSYLYQVDQWEQVRRLIKIGPKDAIFVTNQSGSGKIRVALFACEDERQVWSPIWRDFKGYVETLPKSTTFQNKPAD